MILTSQGEMLIIGLSCRNLSLLTCTGFQKNNFLYIRISSDNLDALQEEYVHSMDPVLPPSVIP